MTLTVEPESFIGPDMEVSDEIAQVILRIRNLTIDDCCLLDYARTPKWDETMDLMYDFTSEMTWEPLFYEVTKSLWQSYAEHEEDPEWAQAHSVAFDTVWGAVLALFVRDKADLPNNAYYILSYPWRSVIGRLHPDDEEVS